MMHDPQVKRAERTDTVSWEAYRMDYILNADWEQCAPEECGAEDALLLLSSEGNGIFLNGGRASCFQIGRPMEDEAFLCVGETLVYGEDQGIFCYGAPWADASCLPHFVRMEGDFRSDALVGSWAMDLQDMEEDAQAWRAWLAEGMDAEDRMTIHFNPDGSGQVQDHLVEAFESLAGDGSGASFQWVYFNGELYFFGDGEPFRKVDYLLQDDTFVLKAVAPWAGFDEEKIAAPIHYDGEAQTSRWVGLWGTELQTDGESRVFLCHLNMDGTMDCRAIAGWNRPEEVLESFRMHWRAAPDGIEVWRDEEAPATMISYKGNLSMSFWRENAQMQRLAAYERMMESVPEGISLEEVLGVWRVEDARAGEDTVSIQLSLNPNGRCARRTMLMPGGDPARAQYDEKSGEWSFAEDGRTIIARIDGQDIPLAAYEGGVLQAQIADDAQAPMVREAGPEAWTGKDGYAVEKLVNYVYTGLVGVWEGRFRDDPMSSSDNILRIYADPTGKAKATFENESGSYRLEALGSWRPDGDGMVLRLRQDLHTPLYKDQDYRLGHSDYNPDLNQLDIVGGNASVTFERIETYWKADFQSAAAADFSVESGVLTAYRGSDTEVVIPGDLGITAIGGTFSGTDVARVIIPEGVIRIGAEAFKGCRSLTEVVLPQSLQAIGESAFEDCVGLKELSLPEGLRQIGERAFKGMENLTALRLPAGLRYIGGCAFMDCVSLTEMEIPSGVRTLKNNLFSGCENLRSVNLPSSLQHIEDRAFSYCASLEALAIPEGVETIREYAFRNCAALTRVDLPYTITEMSDTCFHECGQFVAHVSPGSYAEAFCAKNGISYEAAGQETWDFVLEGGTLVSYVGRRPDVWVSEGLGATAIGADAFANHEDLRTVVIAEGVQTIGAGAFQGCEGLVSVTLPGSLTQIADNAFAGCEGITAHGRDGSAAQSYCRQNGIAFEILDDRDDFIVEQGVLIQYQGFAEEIVIPEDLGIVSLQRNLLAKDERLRRVVIPEGVKELGGGAFKECPNLKEVVLPEGLEKINDESFMYCVALERIDIPEGVKALGSFAFYGCSGLKEISLPTSLREIERGALTFCSELTALAIPEGVDTLGEDAVSYCESLTNLTLPSTLMTIEEGVFRECKGLEHIEIPQGAKKLGSHMFLNCTALKEVTIPSSVNHMGEGIFEGCPEVRLIVEPGSEAEFFAQKYAIAYEASSFEAPGGDETPAEFFQYEVTDGNTVTVNRYVGQDEFVHLPAQIDGLPVAAIGAEAFAENENLKQVAIPEGIAEIGDLAFFGCSSLNSVTLPESAVTFGRFAFNNCPQLKLRVRAGSAGESYAQSANLAYAIVDE